MAAGYCYFLGINSNAFFLKDNKKTFILGLNVPKVTAYEYFLYLGMQGDTGGGTDDTCIVYCYRITSSTIE